MGAAEAAEGLDAGGPVEEDEAAGGRGDERRIADDAVAGEVLGEPGGAPVVRLLVGDDVAEENEVEGEEGVAHPAIMPDGPR